MSRPRPRPLFSASAPEVHEDVPGDSRHPASFTERMRRLLLTNGEALFTAERRQAEYHAKLDENPAQPRN
jgi:hypothetical protein